mgnify:CR=1 FL=1
MYLVKLFFEAQGLQLLLNNRPANTPIPEEKSGDFRLCRGYFTSVIHPK